MSPTARSLMTVLAAKPQPHDLNVLADDERELLFELIDPSSGMLDFLQTYLQEVGESSEVFTYGLRYLDTRQLGRLLRTALKLLARQPDHPGATAVVRLSNHRIPGPLHRALQAMFDASRHDDPARFPWHGADPGYIRGFKRRLKDPATPLRDKQVLFNCLLWSRTYAEGLRAVLKTLADQGFNPAELASLKRFHPRRGFDMLSASDLEEALRDFSQKTMHQLIPLFYDNGNYLCVYKEGPLRGMVCEYHHEETHLAPLFRSMNRLIELAEAKPACDDWIKLPFDFPPLDKDFTARDAKALAALHQAYGAVRTAEEDFETRGGPANDEYHRRIQTAFCIFHLTPRKLAATLLPFLDDDDMFVQEAAIQAVGQLGYRPAREKLAALVHTAKSNGRIAAEGVLRQWGQATTK